MNEPTLGEKQQALAFGSPAAHMDGKAYNYGTQGAGGFDTKAVPAAKAPGCGRQDPKKPHNPQGWRKKPISRIQESRRVEALSPRWPIGAGY